MEEDNELELITRRKLAEMKRRVEAATTAKQASAAEREKTDREVVLGILFDRGDEVLSAALLVAEEAHTEGVVEDTDPRGRRCYWMKCPKRPKRGMASQPFEASRDQ